MHGADASRWAVPAGGRLAVGSCRHYTFEQNGTSLEFCGDLRALSRLMGSIGKRFALITRFYGEGTGG
ncbi:MAG: hypothetical protein CMJ70_17535 [Planctomycetaceae bacterium]|nr:hypothetical protein [Planctomycetaceae bacterium]HAA72287.1 hypothetical protein [Planctomycetaceae bacterium]